MFGFVRALVIVACATTAAAHGGGRFRGPSGGVPPELRVTPPHPPVAPADSAPATGTPRLPRALPMWWERRAPALLDLKRHLYAPRMDASSPLWSACRFTRANEERAMRRAVANRIIPTLRNVLEDPSRHREIHYAARIALARLDEQGHAPTVGDIEELRLVVERMHDPATPPLTLRAAIMAAGRLAPAAEPTVRRAIVNGFRAIVRDTNADLDVRVVTCFALADAKTHASRLDLVDFVRTGSLPIRLAALLALHGRRSELTPKEHRLVAAAVRQLNGPRDYASMIDICRGLYGDKSAIPDLVQRASAVPNACLALGLMGEAQAGVLEALWSVMLKTDSPELRRSAALALVMLREPKVAHVLNQRLAQSETFTEQSSIVDVLGRIGSAADVEALIALLLDERRPIALRASAVQALGRMGDLRPRSAFEDDAAIFVPGLSEPAIDAWLAQR